MNGTFAVVLTPDAPKDLLLWAVTDGDPPYLHCNLLEESICGLVRVQVMQASPEKSTVTLLVPARYVAFALEGLMSKPLGFVPATP